MKMTNTSKSTTPKKKSIAHQRALKVGESSYLEFLSKGDDYLVFPVGALVLVSLYIFAVDFGSFSILFTPSFLGIIAYPAFPAFLIALFGLGYIYKIMKRESIGKLPKMMASILLVIFAFFIIAMASIIGGKGNLCSGGQGCVDSSTFMASIVFANPITLMLLSALAITGGIGLLRRSKK